MRATGTAPASEQSLLEAATRLAEAERQGDVVALEQLLAPEYQGYDPAGRSPDRASVWRDGRWLLIASQDTRLPR